MITQNNIMISSSHRRNYFQYFLVTVIVGMFSLQSSFAQVIPHNKLLTEHIITENDTLVPALVNKVADYSLAIRRSNTIVQRTVKMEPIITALPDIEKRLDGFRERLDKKGFEMNLRSLNSALIIIK